MASASAETQSQKADPIITGSTIGVTNNALASLSGQWRVTALRSGHTCTLNLSRMSAIGGYRVEKSEACQSSNYLSRVSVWRPGRGDSIIMEDAAGNAVLEWSQGEFNGFDAVWPKRVMLTLEPVSN